MIPFKKLIIALVLTLKSLIYFELIFVYCEVGVQIYSFACGCTVNPATLLKRFFFLIE